MQRLVSTDVALSLQQGKRRELVRSCTTQSACGRKPSEHTRPSLRSLSMALHSLSQHQPAMHDAAAVPQQDYMGREAARRCLAVVLEQLQADGEAGPPEVDVTESASVPWQRVLANLNRDTHRAIGAGVIQVHVLRDQTTAAPCLRITRADGTTALLVPGHKRWALHME